MNVSFLQELLNSVAEQGRSLLPRSLFGAEPKDGLNELVNALVSGRGEASGVAIAREIQKRYRQLKPDERLAFFGYLADEMNPDAQAVRSAAANYLQAPSFETLEHLRLVSESPRQEFFRRLNLAPGATADIVSLRRDLLRVTDTERDFAAVDADLLHLLASWFNRGFLVLKRIDWQTPAAILEKIMAYEAVHKIESWEDLRRRLDPADRRCFAFFHPALVDEPVIFVEVALVGEISASIQDVLSAPIPGAGADGAPSVAVFYSISNCQAGLKGISFGNFLIKQVVEELAREVPSLKTFVTLSPIPHFNRWLDALLGDAASPIVSVADRVALEALKDPGWFDAPDYEDAVKNTHMGLAAHYFLAAKTAEERPVDPVARFHLGNGASLHRINWRGDVSKKGLAESNSLMVNYRYDLGQIESNHEAYANDGRIAASRAVTALLRPIETPAPLPETPQS